MIQMINRNHGDVIQRMWINKQPVSAKGEPVMKRVQRAVALITTMIILGAITGFVGCSHGGGDTTAPPSGPEMSASTTPAPSITGDTLALGYFQFVFDDDGTVRIEETSPYRDAQVNVTSFVSLVLEGFYWNEEERNWHLQVGIKNVSVFTGYDVWIILHSLGPKMCANPDGFTWILPPIFPDPQRCAFIAYGKGNVNRAYPPGFYDVRDIVLHQPEGVPQLAPIGFWIDATGVPRKTPGVEDLHLESIDETNYHLTGFVWDHQSPSEDLIVWADTSHFNSNSYEQMFDDGEHGDGDAGDNIFGCDFEGNPPDGPYKVTVYAFDPQQNQGENDIWFYHGEHEPCDKPMEPVPFFLLDKGEHSGVSYPYEAVVTNPEAWMALWQEHSMIWEPPPPPPPVDFENHNVIGIWVGARPSNNHMVHVTDVLFDPCEFIVTVHYDYTPYEACGPLDVMTNPYEMIVLPKFEWPIIFVGKEVDCPPPPPECIEPIPFETIQHGDHSGITHPYEMKITNMDQFQQLWQEHSSIFFPPPPMPMINFENHDLYAVGLGNRPTGGFSVEIYKLCWLTDQSVGVFYKEWIPGPDCMVPMVITQPYHWVVAPKNFVPPHWFPSHEVYNCPSGDCEPVDFWPLADGHMSCEPQKTIPIHGPDMMEDIWHGIHCGDPNMPPPPPVAWGAEVPFLIQTAGFPTGGFYVTVEGVCVNYEEQFVRVDWTLHVPGPDCAVPQVPTQPWFIGSTPQFPGILEFDWNFNGHEEVYNCPPCEEVPSFQLADNEMGCAEPGEYGFQGFSDAFEKLWYDLNCWDPDHGIPPPELPPIPPPIDPGWETKPFAIQLDERMTSGYYLTLDYVCLEGCTAIVYYTEHIPGEDCPTADVITKPWLFGVAQFPPIDCEINWEFIKHEEVYNCPGDCQPLQFWETADGMHGCAEPGEYGWQYMEPYHQMWLDFNCYDPSSGEEPPPLPGDPEPGPNMLINHLGIQLGTRPSTGYYITVDKVCIEGCDVFVEWTEHIPGPDCNVYWVETKPWIVGAVEMPTVFCAWQWHFTKSEELYSCNEPDCWEFESIDGGPHGPHEPGGWFFDNMAGFHYYWNLYHAGDPMPSINFQGGYGAYAIHLGERPTSGFEVSVFEICASDDPFGAAVRWTELIPGESCPVDQVITHPWRLVTFPLVDLPYFDQGFEEVYQCD